MNSVGRFMNRRVAVASLVAAVALGIVALGATRLISGTDAASLVATQARTAAISALENQYLAMGSDDSAAIDRLFTGAALEEMRQHRPRIRQMIADQTDYPGRRMLSNVRWMSVAGDSATTFSLRFMAHVKQANMKDGLTVDYSQADEIIQVVVVRDAGDGGAWKISNVSWQYAPGSGP
ncbi:MAG TPA: hypothetical protein VLM76_11370 [Patescibacteria group bacterium]|nr:hypothetical protein [Patescibacteria group bacterium]